VQGPDLGDDRCRFARDALRGVANRVLPGEREPDVLLAVGLHVALQAVPLPAIDLDHQPMLGPVDVDELAGDHDVGARLWQTGLADQREQVDLGL
jgi:hypothetical protein